MAFFVVFWAGWPERMKAMKKIKDFAVREIAGECLLVPMDTTAQAFNGLISLSDTARFIWENIEKVDSLKAMVDMMVQEYEIDEQTAARDAVRFISHLVQIGFVAPTKEDHTW